MDNEDSNENKRRINSKEVKISFLSYPFEIKKVKKDSVEIE